MSCYLHIHVLNDCAFTYYSVQYKTVHEQYVIFMEDTRQLCSVCVCVMQNYMFNVGYINNANTFINACSVYNCT